MTGGPVHGFVALHRKALQWGVLAVGLLILVIWSDPTVLGGGDRGGGRPAVVGLLGVFAGTGGGTGGGRPVPRPTAPARAGPPRRRVSRARKPPAGPTPARGGACAEPIHAVTYFAPESLEALRRAPGCGDSGWGYFVARVAPGRRGRSSAVAALFFNFHPAMVRRSVPDVLDLRRPPATVLVARRQGAARALRRLDPSVEGVGPPPGPPVGASDRAGRRLGPSAVQCQPGLGPPARIRSKRCGRPPPACGSTGVTSMSPPSRPPGSTGARPACSSPSPRACPPQLFQASRGWSGDEWEVARARLETGAWWGAEGTAAAGLLQLCRAIEQTTDDLAAPPFLSLPAREAEEVLASVRSVAGAVAEGGDIPFPSLQPTGCRPPGRPSRQFPSRPWVG